MSQTEALLLFVLMVGVLLVWVAAMAWSARDSALRPRASQAVTGADEWPASSAQKGRGERAGHHSSSDAGPQALPTETTSRPAHSRSRA
ncbi:hypothetical protein FBY26_2280 [Phycicoccus sp. SLBN-51]|nr:hypothetical protein FBY26_2280 [Phycicoccus sp. SLBN-51]